MLNDSVYDRSIKAQLSTFENSSSWDYIKSEPIDIGEEHQPPLKDLINNSAKYKKTVEFGIKKLEKAMVDRAYKYALLMVVYAYESIRIVRRIDFNLSTFEDTFSKISKLPKSLQKDNSIQDYRFKFYNSMSYEKAIEVCLDLIKDTLNHILKSDEVNKINLTVDRHPKSRYSNTHVLPQDYMEKYFKGFSEPLEGDSPYNFHIIPSANVDIKKHLESIFKLAEVEFKYVPEFD